MANKTKKFNKLYLIPAAILVLLLLAFLGRGWIRTSFVPSMAGLVYTNQVQSILDQEYASLQQPFETLGMPDIHKERKCELGRAKHFKMTLYCGATYSSYTAHISPKLAAGSAKLSSQFTNKGWSLGYTDLATLGKNISQGIDYTPDAGYTKFKGDIACLADFTTAFSKPKPPAINGYISCTKAVDIF